MPSKKFYAHKIDMLYGYLRAAGAEGFTTKDHCVNHARLYAAEYFRLPSVTGWHNFTEAQLARYVVELEQLLTVQYFTYYLDSYVGETVVDLAKRAGEASKNFFVKV